MDMTEKQKWALQSVAGGPGLMPIIHAGKFIAAGYVTKAEGAGAKGYSFVAITPKGKAALA